MKGHRRSFPIIRLTFQVRKVMGGIVQSAMLVCAVSYVGGLWDYSDRPSPIWDLGIGLGLVNILNAHVLNFWFHHRRQIVA